MLKLLSPGLYLLGGGKKVQVSTEEFLLILLHSPSSQSSGIILEQPDEHYSDFLSELTELYHKYSKLPDVDPALIKVKVLGARPQFAPLMVGLRSWLKRHQIPAVVNDFGKALAGTAFIESSNGKIGFQICKKWQEPVTLLSRGTAQNRLTNQKPLANILILSKSQNIRILAKQAVEEEISWQAHCPTDLRFNSLELLFNESKFSALIFTEDLANDPEICQWILESTKENPRLVLGCIGSKLPSWGIPRMRLLPPLEPYLIPQFKKILMKSFADLLFSDTSDTLAFPKKIKA